MSIARPAICFGQRSSTGKGQTCAEGSASTSYVFGTLVVLGAAGDLTQRLLLPGIATLLETQPERELELVGVDPGTGAPLAGRPSIQAQVSFRAAQR